MPAPTSLALALCLALPAIAQAQTSPAGIPAPTHDWGCEVLLCLANPQGPTAAPPCVPPIERLWRELAAGHRFPSCSMARGPNGRSYARPAYTYYDHCPEGTTDLAAGQQAQLEGNFPPPAPPPTPAGAPSAFAPAAPFMTYTGIGNGDDYGMPSPDGPPPAKVCVAGPRGTRVVTQGDNQWFVNLYDTVYVAPAQANPQLVEVYIDDAFWLAVRY